MAFTEGQIAGSMVALAITALLYAGSFLPPLSHRPNSPIPFLAKTAASIAVELSGKEAGKRGIYFVPEGTTVGDFLTWIAGESPAGLAGKSAGTVLRPGSSLLIVRHAEAPPQCIVGEMRAGQKIALGLPVNVNHATYEELLLIPGIGAKTAAEIISLRQTRRRIHHLDELMDIRGIKEKRLAKLQKYLTVGGAQ